MKGILNSWALSPLNFDRLRQLTDAPRVYVDANLPRGVVTFMRQTLHLDVLFVLEDPELRRAPIASISPRPRLAAR